MDERHYTNKLGWEETARASLGVMLAFLVGWLINDALPPRTDGHPVEWPVAGAQRQGPRPITGQGGRTWMSTC